MQPIQIAGQQRPDIGADRRGAGALELADFRQHLAGQEYRRRRAAPRAAPRRRGVRAQSFRKENRNDTATVCRPAAGSPRSAPAFVRRQRRDDLALGVDPFGDLEPIAARHQDRRPSWNRSYRSARDDRRSSSRSRKPRVAMKPHLAPLFSSSALVTTVVACDSRVTSAGSIAFSASPWRMPSITPWPKSRGVVRTLAMPMRPLSSSTIATSVKVPPISMPIRQAIHLAPQTSVTRSCSQPPA